MMMEEFERDFVVRTKYTNKKEIDYNTHKATVSIDSIEIVGCNAFNNPLFRKYLESDAKIRTDYEINIDFTIPNIKHILGSKSLETSLRIWNYILDVDCKLDSISIVEVLNHGNMYSIEAYFDHYTKAYYSPNNSARRKSCDSTLLYYLKTIPWIPDKSGENFYRPADILPENINDKFIYKETHIISSMKIGSNVLTIKQKLKHIREDALEFGYDLIPIEEKEYLNALTKINPHVLVEMTEFYCKKDKIVTCSTEDSVWNEFCINYAAIGYSLPLTKDFLIYSNIPERYINKIQELGELWQSCYFEYYKYKIQSNVDPKLTKKKLDMCFDYAKKIIKLFNCSRRNYKITTSFIDELGGMIYYSKYCNDIYVEERKILNHVSSFSVVYAVIKTALITDIDRSTLAKNVSQWIEVINERNKEIIRNDVVLSEKNTPQTERVTNEIQIKLFNLPASAGTGEPLSDDRYELIDIPETDLNQTADFALKVSGDSMEPKFHDGDIILIKRQQEIAVGEIGVFIKDGEGYVKKFGGNCLISLNTNYKPIPLNEETRCVGIVIGKTKIL